MNEFFGGVAAHVGIALAGGGIGYVVRENLLWLTRLFDPVARKQAAYIRGSWTATEKFADDGSQAQYKLLLDCRGAQVSGTQNHRGGRVDRNATYDLRGTFENLILNVTWTRQGSIESGAATLRYTDDNRLVGHGLYVLNQKVYTSVLTASKD